MRHLLSLAVAVLVLLPVSAQSEEPIVVSDVGLALPESIIHDPVDDVYLVSNVNGGIAEKNDQGFISRLAPDGTLLALRWIDGARDDVELHAPKGLAISGDVLFVADIDTVRLFDRASGAPLGAVAIPGATFLNGLAALPPNGIVGAESALLVEGNTATGTGNDFIYRVAADRSVHVLARSPHLNQPNGIKLLPSGNLLISTRGANEVYELTPAGEKTNVRTLPGRIVDGVGVTPDGRVVASSWETAEVYAVDHKGNVASLFGQLPAPAADFHIDFTRNRMLLPLLRSNSVMFRPLP